MSKRKNPTPWRTIKAYGNLWPVDANGYEIVAEEHSIRIVRAVNEQPVAKEERAVIREALFAWKNHPNLVTKRMALRTARLVTARNQAKRKK